MRREKMLNVMLVACLIGFLPAQASASGRYDSDMLRPASAVCRSAAVLAGFNENMRGAAEALEDLVWKFRLRRAANRRGDSTGERGAGRRLSGTHGKPLLNIVPKRRAVKNPAPSGKASSLPEVELVKIERTDLMGRLEAKLRANPNSISEADVAALVGAVRERRAHGVDALELLRQMRIECSSLGENIGKIVDANRDILVHPLLSEPGAGQVGSDGVLREWPCNGLVYDMTCFSETDSVPSEGSVGFIYDISIFTKASDENKTLLMERITKAAAGTRAVVAFIDQAGSVTELDGVVIKRDLEEAIRYLEGEGVAAVRCALKKDTDLMSPSDWREREIEFIFLNTSNASRYLSEITTKTIRAEDTAYPPEPVLDVFQRLLSDYFSCTRTSNKL